MPTSTAWCDPEVFMEHNGVTVYQTYKDDDIQQGAKTYWFTCDSTSDDHSFDVRDFKTPSRGRIDACPPFLSARSNPAFESASKETQAKWREEWQQWHASGEKEAIRVVLAEAIDEGLISNAPYL